MIFVGTKDGKDYGFYLERDGLKDLVELTDEEHMALMDGQADGNVIVFHKGGKPTLEAPLPPSDDELARAARQKRDALIAAIQVRAAIMKSGRCSWSPPAASLLKANLCVKMSRRTE